ncbi:MAG: heavy-metal-associated domain-containing protein [Nitrososphaerota archaeon]|nr:heavy-metal-associated domain-containing protein [Nitrososphaerota archaeon]
MTVADQRKQRVAFTVQSIDCIACSPVFRRHLGKMAGVLEVSEFPITNKVAVTFDEEQLNRKVLEDEIARTAKQAGLGEVIFERMQRSGGRERPDEPEPGHS